MEPIQYKPLPFDLLATPRKIKPQLPFELDEFYTTHEGFGIDYYAEISLRFAQLIEVEVLTLEKTNLRGMIDPEWQDFEGYMIAASIFGDEIYYVIKGPLAHGTILMIGPNVPTGIMDGALVLGRSFVEWINYLKEHNFHDDAILHRESISQVEIVALNLRLNELNPLMKSRSSS